MAGNSRNVSRRTARKKADDNSAPRNLKKKVAEVSTEPAASNGVLVEEPAANSRKASLRSHTVGRRSAKKGAIIASDSLQISKVPKGGLTAISSTNNNPLVTSSRLSLPHSAAIIAGPSQLPSPSLTVHRPQRAQGQLQGVPREKSKCLQPSTPHLLLASSPPSIVTPTKDEGDAVNVPRGVFPDAFNNSFVSSVEHFTSNDDDTNGNQHSKENCDAISNRDLLSEGEGHCSQDSAAEQTDRGTTHRSDQPRISSSFIDSHEDGEKLCRLLLFGRVMFAHTAESCLAGLTDVDSTMYFLALWLSAVLSFDENRVTRINTSNGCRVFVLYRGAIDYVFVWKSVTSSRFNTSIESEQDCLGSQADVVAANCGAAHRQHFSQVGDARYNNKTHVPKRYQELQKEPISSDEVAVNKIGQFGYRNHSDVRASFDSTENKQQAYTPPNHHQRESVLVVIDGKLQAYLPNILKLLTSSMQTVFQPLELTGRLTSAVLIITDTMYGELDACIRLHLPLALPDIKSSFSQPNQNLSHCGLTSLNVNAQEGSPKSERVIQNQQERRQQDEISTKKMQSVNYMASPKTARRSRSLGLGNFITDKSAKGAAFTVNEAAFGGSSDSDKNLETRISRERLAKLRVKHEFVDSVLANFPRDDHLSETALIRLQAAIDQRVLVIGIRHLDNMIADINVRGHVMVGRLGKIFFKDECACELISFIASVIPITQCNSAMQNQAFVS